MRAVLMAGGSGTRLRPLTCDLPKPMVTILNRPIVEHILHLLERHGIGEVIATLHYLPDVVRDRFGDGSEYGVKMHYVVEEEQPLGTAGCVKNVAEFLTETFVVISGDSVTDIDLSAALRFHQRKGAMVTIVLKRTGDPTAFGVVIVDEDQRIRRFLEKPTTSEVFSDTVNTGIYILEPEVLNFLAPDVPSDFSLDLFPQLLAQGVPMYGYVAEGYWCDVGSLDAYRQAQYDAIRGRVDLRICYPLLRAGVWVGEGTRIDPSARIEPPVLIGEHCEIGPRVRISAGSIIGDRVVIGAGADLQHPILGHGVMVGEEAQLWACTLSRNVRVHRRAHIMEGVAIGTGSIIGEEARVHPDVRVWPGKRIDAGATLNRNLIWGATATRNLFGHRGVSGLANIEITPEFAVKLGAAWGATLPVGASVTISRDQRNICRMVSRALIAGLMSVGTSIQNLEATAIPIARYILPSLNAAGGCHIRIDPDRSDRIVIEFFDQNGINLSKAQEKKIEAAFFKEDYRRARIEDIGDISYPARVLDYYNSGFARNLNVEAIRNSSIRKVAIDYVYAVSGAVLPRILGKFSTDVVVLNASLNEVALSEAERHGMLRQLADVVQALRANFGMQVFANGERSIPIDETGFAITGELLLAVLTELALTAQPGGTVVVPVSASGALERIAQNHSGRILRVKANPTALMQACQGGGNVVMGGAAETGFIFPQLHPGFDAMFGIAKIIEWLTVQERSLAQVRLSLPPIYHRSCQVRCPWSLKGALMRHLVEVYGRDRLELLDGVKIFHGPEDWVLVLPDASEPLVRVFANVGESRGAETWVEQNLNEMRSRIEAFCQSQNPLDEETQEVRESSLA